METWKTVAMGIVEGLTEFLPISSTGHMILVGDWIAFPKDLEKTFDVFIQLGAILAVVLYYQKRIRSWVSTFRPATAATHPVTMVMVAFLPCAVVGLACHKWIEAHLRTPLNVALALIVGGIAIELVERRAKTATTDRAENISLKQAIAIGCFQCLALFPGVSRSAATIMGGMLFGLTLPAAAEFSFFLAIPTMFAASGYSLLKVYKTLSADYLVQLAIGFWVAFAVAWVVIGSFLKYIQTNSFRPFVIYRILLGLAVLGYSFR